MKTEKTKKKASEEAAEVGKFFALLSWGLMFLGILQLPDLTGAVKMLLLGALCFVSALITAAIWDSERSKEKKEARL
jgi:hypothetical protein